MNARPRDIQFSCEGCGQQMVIDKAGAHLVIQCPKCGRDVIVPNPVRAPKGQELTIIQSWTPPPANPSKNHRRTPVDNGRYYRRLNTCGRAGGRATAVGSDKVDLHNYKWLL
jgi:ribosomal protein S27E